MVSARGVLPARTRTPRALRYEPGGGGSMTVARVMSRIVRGRPVAPSRVTEPSITARFPHTPRISSSSPSDRKQRTARSLSASNTVKRMPPRLVTVWTKPSTLPNEVVGATSGSSSGHCDASPTVARPLDVSKRIPCARSGTSAARPSAACAIGGANRCPFGLAIERATSRYSTSIWSSAPALDESARAVISRLQQPDRPPATSRHFRARRCRISR